MPEELRQKIQKALPAIANANGEKQFCNAADEMTRLLGYSTNRQRFYQKGEFLKEFDDLSIYEECREHMRYRFEESVQSVYVASQFIEEDFNRFSLPATAYIGSTMKCLFVFAKLENLPFQLRDYVEMTKLFNRHITMSFFVVYSSGRKLYTAFARRRFRKNLYQPNKAVDMIEDTLSDVHSVSNIDCDNPHPVHLEILGDLSASSVESHLLSGGNNLFENLYSQWEYILRPERQHVIREEELQYALRNIFRCACGERYISEKVIIDWLSNIVYPDFFERAVEVLTLILQEYNIEVCDYPPNEQELRDQRAFTVDSADIDSMVEAAMCDFRIDKWY